MQRPKHLNTPIVHISTKMIICRDHLFGMGFEEIAPYLFMKQLETGTKLYADYREDKRKLYAYRQKEPMRESLFNEFRAIKEIERRMSQELTAYV